MCPRTRIFVTLIIVLSNFFVVAAQRHVTLIDNRNCSHPDTPLAKSTPVSFYLETHNNSRGNRVGRGNITIREDTGGDGYAANIRLGLQVGNQVIWKYRLNHVSCDHFIGKQVLNMYRIRYDKRCVVKKGFYSFDNILIDMQFSNILKLLFRGMQTLTCGTAVGYSDVHNRTHTLACWITRFSLGPCSKTIE